MTALNQLSPTLTLHPSYGSEWKQFWEKRYKELQVQGKDAANHDYKSEWIPYWTKRVASIFDTEVSLSA